MSPQIDMARRIERAIGRRVSMLRRLGNQHQAKLWEAEARSLTSGAFAARLAEIGFDPDCLETLGIYVAQKVRRLVAASLGVGRADPYTETVLINARASAVPGVVSTRDIKGALSGKPGQKVWRAGNPATANVQASSTRLALAAVGAAVAKGRGNSGRLYIDLKHPLVRHAGALSAP